MTSGVARQQVSVLGIRITDVTKSDAMRLLMGLICAGDERCHSVFIVNAHTLNVATDDPAYANVLNSADYVFSDGTGVRWAARQRGVKLLDNLNGTDLIPKLFRATAGRGYLLFLLGADPEAIQGAAAFARREFCDWTLVGHHHGYVHQANSEQVVEQINASNAHLLLVGMGNPIQERWIHSHQARLRVPLAVGVGGLFNYWAGGLQRAPSWVRRVGCEWIHLLLKQPHKWERYLLGNPKFLYRMTRARKQDIAASNPEMLSPPTASKPNFSAEARGSLRFDTQHRTAPAPRKPH
jgi:N-acetylglucosaminyldiphosphoundecaprenol N-acetyl-beta-D-mannosaminyltransferase